MPKERFERGNPKMSFDEIASKVTCPNEVRKATLQKMQNIEEKLKKGQPLGRTVITLHKDDNGKTIADIKEE